MEKEDVVHIYSGTLAIKKNEILPFPECGGLRDYYANEISQTEKDK